MTDFGDYDPEDAWDARDAVTDQVTNIARRVAWLIDHRDDGDLAARVRRIVDDLGTIRRRILDRDF